MRRLNIWDKMAFDRPPVPARFCGPCSACCTWGPPLGEPKPGQDACVQVGATGCSAYATRPVSPCRLFQCAWLQNEGLLKDRDRPDLLGVIVDERHEDRPDFGVRGAEKVFIASVRSSDVLQVERVVEVLTELAWWYPVVVRGPGYARVHSLPTRRPVEPGLAAWLKHYVEGLKFGVLR